LKFPFIQNPRNGKPDEMVTIVMIATIATVARFLVDGISLKIEDFSISFGHLDASLYVAILGPILGAHSFLGNKKDDKNGPADQN
jgi:hypothetical protein